MIIREASTNDAAVIAVQQHLSVLAGTGCDRVLVAEQDGLVHGVLSLHWIPLLHRDRPLGRITARVVDEGARGRGVGSRLIAKRSVSCKTWAAVLWR